MLQATGTPPQVPSVLGNPPKLLDLFRDAALEHGHTEAWAGRVSVSTQNQALNAIVFLYRDVLDLELGRVDAVRARRPRRLPTVLAPEEVAQDQNCSIRCRLTRTALAVRPIWAATMSSEPVPSRASSSGVHHCP